MTKIGLFDKQTELKLPNSLFCLASKQRGINYNIGKVVSTAVRQLVPIDKDIEISASFKTPHTLSNLLLRETEYVLS